MALLCFSPVPFNTLLFTSFSSSSSSSSSSFNFIPKHKVLSSFNLIPKHKVLSSFNLIPKHKVLSSFDLISKHRVLPSAVGRVSTIHAQPYQRVEFSSLSDDDDDEVSFDAIPSLPPSKGRLEIMIDNDIIKRLDLSPAHTVLRDYVHQTSENTYTSELTKDPKELLQQTIGFTIKYEREDPHDVRELSEIPDIRLWFVRLDGAYPWLPIVLDWRGGELARYAAMLVPHEMNKKMGIVFNPEALELFAMSKLFTVYSWLEAMNVSKADVRVNEMLQILGFKVEEELFEVLKTT